MTERALLHELDRRAILGEALRKTVGGRSRRQRFSGLRHVAVLLLLC